MKENNTAKKQKSNSVDNILQNFKKNLYGIEYYFDKFGGLAQGADSDEIKKSQSFVDSCLSAAGIKPDEPNSYKKLSKEELYNLAKSLIKPPKISTKNFEILSRSSFLMLNNYFEYLLSDLLSYHYNKYQKSLNEKKFTMNLKEINEFETIEEVTKALITKEVESMMVEMTFDELVEHFNTTLGISKEKDIISWDSITEFRERRHLIVHNSSIVNKKYIVRTKNPYNFNIGDTINIDTDYFKKSCGEFFLAGLLLSYNSWGKWDKETIDDAIEQMLDDSFDLLKNNDFDLVTRLTAYALKIEARTNEQAESLLRLKVNQLIAHKKLENTAILNKELRKIKTGTLSPLFKLAFAILADNFKIIPELVIQTKSLNEIDKNKYLEWPLFEFIRDNDSLNKEILEIIEEKPNAETQSQE